MGLMRRLRGKELAAKMRADLERHQNTPEWLLCPCGRMYNNRNIRHAELHVAHIRQSYS